jgi:hypothetical protein|tara:strand:+ start:31595 stop:32533 length:939 start_codon:yes stop_codon:yes gene_type:complete
MSNEKNNPLLAMLSQYEKATSNSSESTFNPDNYFTTYLPDGVDSAMKRIRILPTNDGTSPFQEVHVHSAKVDGKNRKFVCIKHLSNEDCPFCELREELLSTGEKSDEELAKQFKPRLMYVVRIIDRENEDHGPKFWRFPINYKKEGIFDKIMATIGLLKEDITNDEKGRDIIINIVRVKNPRGGTYPTVNSVQAFDRAPLSEDSELSTKWLNSEKTWKDVYSVKGYDYLKLVATGKNPAWDKKLEKFVDKDELESQVEDSSSDLDSQITMGGTSKTPKPKTEVASEEVTETSTPEVKVPETVDEGEDDDLPF